MDIDEVFRKLKPVMGRKLELLWQEYILAGPDIRRMIEQTLRVMLARRYDEAFDSRHVLLAPPPEDVARGEYPLGVIHYANDSFYPFGLREAEFIQHIGLFGRSGSGKTNVCYLILQTLVRAGKPFLVFDWKRNYRDLLSLPEFKDLLVFTVGRIVAPFRFNPLVPPPGTPATVWLKKLIEIMCHAYFLGEGVAVLLMRAIDSLYRERGIYQGRTSGHPTMHDVRNWLVAYGAKGREASWMESAMRAVEVLCFGEVGGVLNRGSSFDIGRLLNKQVILELDALTNSDKTFLIESLLLWIHHYRMAEPDRERFKHAVIIEEAHHILLRKKQEVSGEESVTDVLLREIRELGESIICLDQHPSLISKPALGNTYTTFAMNLKHRGDIAMIKDCLLLDSEQAGYLGKLEIGWAVAKLQGRWFKPFLVKFPEVKLKKGAISDERLHARHSAVGAAAITGGTAGNGNSSVIPCQEGSSTLRREREADIPVIPDTEKRERNGGEKDKRCTIGLTTKEERLLKDVLRYKSSSVTERYVRLGFSSRVGNSAQKSLAHRGFLSSISVPVGNGRVKVLRVTKRGHELLGAEIKQATRHGGTAHQYWKDKLAARLRGLGYEVREECPIGSGKTVDLLAVKDGRRVAFEVETGKSDVAANAGKAQAAGIDRLVIVATSSRVRHSLTRAITPIVGVDIVTAQVALAEEVW